MKCELKKETINSLFVFDFEKVVSEGDAGAEGNIFENAAKLRFKKFNAF